MQQEDSCVWFQDYNIPVSLKDAGLASGYAEAYLVRQPFWQPLLTQRNALHGAAPARLLAQVLATPAAYNIAWCSVFGKWICIGRIYLG